ncbi:hypothetical protein WDU94_010775 [Cyamophila willieti]
MKCYHTKTTITQIKDQFIITHPSTDTVILCSENKKIITENITYGARDPATKAIRIDFTFDEQNDLTGALKALKEQLELIEDGIGIKWHNATQQTKNTSTVDPQPGSSSTVDPQPGRSSAIDPQPGSSSAVDIQPGRSSAIDPQPGRSRAVDPQPGGSSESDQSEKCLNTLSSKIKEIRRMNEENRLRVHPETPKPSNSASPASTDPDPSPTLSFHDILPTPKRKRKTQTKRQTAINSRGIILKSELFPIKERNNNTEVNPKARKMTTKRTTKVIIKQEKTTKKTARKEKSPEKESPSWFCYLCGESSVMDMRCCCVCGEYVHEECVGLTKADKDIFICPECT